jgi:hypothetical protein
MKIGEHCTHEEWDVKGQYLSRFEVWTGERGIMHGLRFVASDGNESPLWGFPGYESDEEDVPEEQPLVGELKATREGFSPALKVWYDRDFGVMFGERIVAALQIMEIEKGQNDDLAESFSGMTT